jgi:hypothetical protein
VIRSDRDEGGGTECCEWRNAGVGTCCPDTASVLVVPSFEYKRRSMRPSEADARLAAACHSGIPDLFSMEKALEHPAVPQSFTDFNIFVKEYGHQTGRVLVYLPERVENQPSWQGFSLEFEGTADNRGAWVPRKVGSRLLGKDDGAEWARMFPETLSTFGISSVRDEFYMSVANWVKWNKWATTQYYNGRGSLPFVLALVDVKVAKKDVDRWERSDDSRDVRYGGRFCFTRVPRYVIDNCFPDWSPRFSLVSPIPGVTFLPWEFQQYGAIDIHLQLAMTNLAYHAVWVPLKRGK